jgi:L-alanine-DL-glutamate epimerase-like enolase superfamily enzyme/catechol 2,3-dioxygenase-like lactoylglutathione lyase family enzyme
MRPTIIESLSAEPLTMPLLEPFVIATGAAARAENALVRVRLAGGAVGLGEAAPLPAVSGETQEGALAAVRAAAPLVVGRDAGDWRAIAATLAEALPVEPAARCGVEQAILDALARHHRAPLSALFGAASGALETDLTIVAGDVEHAAASARQAFAAGFRALKVKVGAATPDEDARRLAAVHGVAPGARLLADANGGYDEGGALRFLTEVARAGVPLALFEQPVPREDADGLLRVAREGGVLVCADESARSSGDVLALARSGARIGVNVKIMKCGIVEALSMWAVARAASLPLMIGGMVESELAMSVSAHLAVGLGGASFVDLDTPMFLASSPFRGGFAQRGPELLLDGAAEGHGVSLDSGAELESRPRAAHHVAVVVADLSRAEAFYAGTLGLPVVRRWADDEGRPRSVWLALSGGAFLALERAGDAGPMRSDAAPGLHCLALAIAPDERAKLRARLESRGSAIVRQTAFTLYTRDPDENLVALSHYPVAGG